MCHRVCAACVFVSSLVFTSVHLLGQTSGAWTALVHATVIDATGDAPKPDSTVLLRGSQIVEVGNFSAVQIPAAARVTDYSGKFLVPGLWDMHVHIRGGMELLKANESFLTLYVVNGVTGIREMGGDLVDVVLQWRREIADGTRFGPRIVTAGPKIDGPRPSWPGSLPVNTPDEGRRAINEVHRLGADFVKFYSGVPREAYFASVAEAKKLGLSISGHTPSGVLVQEASDAGQRSIEHLQLHVLPGASRNQQEVMFEAAQRAGSSRPMTFEERYSRLLIGYDRDLARTLMQHLAKNGTWIDPTLTVAKRVATSGETDYERDPRRKYISPRMWASWQAGTRPSQKSAVQQLVLKHDELIRLAREANVGLLGGTDAGASNPYVFPGFGVHEELAALVEAGLTPMEALQTATRNAATFMGMAETLGTIQPGKVADLLVLNRNPLDDIRNTESIKAVVLRGRVLPRQELQQLLAGVATDATAD